MKKIYVKRNGRMYLVTIPFDDAVIAGDFGGISQPTPTSSISPTSSVISSLDDINGLLLDYVADPIYFNGSYEESGISNWFPKAGSQAVSLYPNPSFSTPTYDPDVYGTAGVVVFGGDSLMQMPFFYGGTDITYVYIGDYTPNFGSSGFNTGYPRLAGLANYGNGMEDYNGNDGGIFLYGTGTWNVIRGSDNFSMDLSSNPDTSFYKVILILKYDSNSEVWIQTAYFPDGTSVLQHAGGTTAPYNTDTFNLGGNQEPNLGVFNIVEFGVYDNAISDSDEAKVVEYLKTNYW